MFPKEVGRGNRSSFVTFVDRIVNMQDCKVWGDCSVLYGPSKDLVRVLSLISAVIVQEEQGSPGDRWKIARNTRAPKCARGSWRNGCVDCRWYFPLVSHLYKTCFVMVLLLAPSHHSRQLFNSWLLLEIFSNVGVICIPLMSAFVCKHFLAYLCVRECKGGSSCDLQLQCRIWLGKTVGPGK